MDSGQAVTSHQPTRQQLQLLLALAAELGCPWSSTPLSTLSGLNADDLEHHVSGKVPETTPDANRVTLKQAVYPAGWELILERPDVRCSVSDDGSIDLRIYRTPVAIKGIGSPTTAWIVYDQQGHGLEAWERLEDQETHATEQGKPTTAVAPKPHAFFLFEGEDGALPCQPKHLYLATRLLAAAAPHLGPQATAVLAPLNTQIRAEEGRLWSTFFMDIASRPVSILGH